MKSKRFFRLNAFFFVLVGAVFAGCAEPSARGSVEAGEILYYADETGETSLRLAFGSPVAVPGVEPMCLQVIGRISAGEDSEIIVCPDAEFTSLSAQDWKHPLTGDDYTEFRTIDRGTIPMITYCILTCHDLQKAKEWSTMYPPDDHDRLTLTQQSPGTFLFETNRTTVRDHGTIFEEVWFRIHFKETIPSRMDLSSRMVIDGEEHERPEFSWFLESHEKGPSKPFERDLMLPMGFDTQTVDWSDRPPMGDAVGTYTLDEAIVDALRREGYLQYFQQHPDAFVAYAEYKTFFEEQDGQHEKHWVIMWLDGHEGYWVSCHLIEGGSPIPETAPSLGPSSECYDGKPFRNSVPLRRSDFSGSVRDFQSVVTAWQNAWDRPVALNLATWTVFQLNVPDVKSIEAEITAPPLERPYYMLDHHEGVLETSNYSPSWTVLPPPDWTRTRMWAASVFDAGEGHFTLLNVPRNTNETSEADV